MEGFIALLKEQREECKKLEDKNYELRKELQQKENIIKEVREYIESYGITKEQLKKMSFGSAAPISIGEMLNILEILDKEVN